MKKITILILGIIVLTGYYFSMADVTIEGGGAGDITIESGAVGGGETNTASNVGSAGQGIFKQKTGVDFEHYKVTSTPPISFSLDGTDKIDLTFTSSTDIDANTTHISSDGSDHSDVVLNTSHASSTTTHATTTPATAIEFVIGNGTDVISSGIAGDLEVPFACTFTSVRMFSHTSSTITIDVWKDTYANYPPTDADSITATSTPVITTAKKYEDLSLMSWATSTLAGDILTFNVDNATTTPQVTISLGCDKT